MKFIYMVIFTTIMFLVVPVRAEDEEGNPPAEMTKIMQCMATNIMLSHLHNEIAASLITLSAPEGQTVKVMSKGYADLAKTEIEHVDYFVKIAQEQFIPQIIAHGQTKEEIDEVLNNLLSKILTDIAKNLANPGNGLEEKTAMETVLLNQSALCDSHFAKLIRKNTF